MRTCRFAAWAVRFAGLVAFALAASACGERGAATGTGIGIGIGIGSIARAVSHGTSTATVPFAGNDCARCGQNASTCVNGMATFMFADPLPAGWVAREVLVKVYGNACDATQLDVAVDGTALPTANPPQGACACTGCDLLGVTDYAVPPPDRFPGWVAGGMNRITLSTTAKLCAAYATVDVTGDQGLSVSPSALALAGPAGMTTAPRSVTVANTAGMDALLVNSIAIAGPDAPSFMVAAAPMLPATVAVGAQVKVDVACTPAMGKTGHADLFLDTTPTGKVVVGLTCDAVSPRGPGDPCAQGQDCASGFCADGVCCDAACTGQCATCNAPTMRGHCVAVSGKPMGGRPACAGVPPCGGTCDGTDTASCAYPANNLCNPQSCAQGVAFAAATCDGKGACPTGAMTTCPYGCAGSACAASPPDMAMGSADDGGVAPAHARDVPGSCTAGGASGGRGLGLALLLPLLALSRRRRRAR